jgi:arylsulfatase A-like enzyme
MPDATKRPPNILYIFTDDQSYRSVSAYQGAHPWVDTPNIDRIASEGVRFTSCNTGAWCAPSRATALTGKLQHGIESLRLTGGYPHLNHDPKQCPFWPEVFRQEGWYTGIVGKWHTGYDHGHGRDWDFSAIWDHTQPEIYGPYYRNQSMSINGAPPQFVGGYSTDNYTELALEFLRGRADEPERPWYLWLCYDGVHGPWHVADRHQEDYPDPEQVRTPEDIYPPRPTKAAHMRVYGVWREGDEGQPVGIHDGRTLTNWVQQYNRAVRSLDEGVGRVLAQLEAMGQMDNTLVIFTSDQGFAWGHHGCRHKFAPYDANIKAPLMMRLPGMIPAGTVCETPVAGQDMPPTFFSIAGLPLPWKMHGQDLTPLLRNPEIVWDRPVLLENTRYLFGSDSNVGCGEAENGIPWWISLRQGKYKYIRWMVHGEIEEMYDLEADPEELRNLALEEEYHPTLQRLREAARAELRRTDAGFVDNMPPIHETTAEKLFAIR